MRQALRGTALAAVLGLAGLLALAGARPEDPYHRLLPEILRDAADPVFGPERHRYAMTYGLVLSAAVARGDTETEKATRAWLLDDLDAGGWGTAWTWDPFADGTATPANTPFAISTAIAVDGLLDAGVDVATAERLGRALVTWAHEGWSDGWYWYSLSERDAIEVPNVSAMLAGASARFVAQHGQVLSTEDRALLRDRAQRVLERLQATAGTRLRWPYSARQPEINDLSHHVYILWGAERARDAGIRVGWSRAEAMASLSGYGPVYPADVALSQGMAAREGSPWEVSGTGAALAFVARWSGDVERWSAATCRALDRAPIVPRFAAHALLGLALSDLAACPS